MTRLRSRRLQTRVSPVPYPLKQCLCKRRMPQKTYPKSWRRPSWTIPGQRRNKGPNQHPAYTFNFNFILSWNPISGLILSSKQKLSWARHIFSFFGLLFSNLKLSTLVCMEEKKVEKAGPSLLSTLPSPPLLLSLKKDIQPTALKGRIIHRHHHNNHQYPSVEGRTRYFGSLFFFFFFFFSSLWNISAQFITSVSLSHLIIYKNTFLTKQHESENEKEKEKRGGFRGELVWYI